MKLRDYQVKILEDWRESVKLGEDRGQFRATTGAGKTKIFEEIIAEQIRNSSKLLTINIHYPIRALTADQLQRLHKTFEGMNVTFSLFQSGSIIQRPGRNEVATTSVTELVALDKNARARGDHHIILGTYHSMHKLVGVMQFDISIFDEAHHLTERNWASVMMQLTTEYRAFFTATPREIDEQSLISMSNVSVFGRVVSELPPKVLIALGYQVSPKLINVDVTFDEDDISTGNYMTIIGEAFKAAKADPSVSSMPNHKMLVTFDLLAQIRAATTNEALAEMWDIIGHKVAVFTTGSDYNDTAHGLYKGRTDVVNEFANYNGDAILMHVDTVGEGIDVPGMSSSLIMSAMNSKGKFLQNVGRIARPAPEDLVNGEPVAKEYRIKKHCIVITVTLNGLPLFGTAEQYIEALMLGDYGDLVDIITAPTAGSFGKPGEDEKTLLTNEVVDLSIRSDFKCNNILAFFDDIEEVA